MVDFNKALEAALGASYDEIVARAQERYPYLPIGSRHHALGAEQAAARFGFIPSQLMGLGVEAAEALQTGRNTNLRDTATDIAANALGGLRGAASRYIPMKQRGGKVSSKKSNGPKLRIPAKQLLPGYASGGAVASPTPNRNIPGIMNPLSLPRFG